MGERDRASIDTVLTWQKDYCKHCEVCINICPVKNLEFKDGVMSSNKKCIQCQLCMKYCPDFAIEVKPKEAKK